MNPRLRATAKRLLPLGVKRMVHRFRQAVSAPPIDDVVLVEFGLIREVNETPRLNFVIPNLATSQAFGGVNTGIDIFLRLAASMNRTQKTDVRLILGDPDRETNAAIMTRRADAAGLNGEAIEILEIRGETPRIPTRARDIFVSYNWWTALNINRLVAAQAKEFQYPVLPLIYLIQEYEPNMYPFSSAHMLAREAYDTPARLWGIFNSVNLSNYYEIQGHRTESSFVFEPVINEQLRPFLARAGSARRDKRIVVYGRPSIARNCFPALVRGLRRWADEYPLSRDWDVVSAGVAHKPIALGNGNRLASLGKLSLDEYADLMLESSVGVCLMASPHPSYPPLEMAHFGMRVVSNDYRCKQIDERHPNIISCGSICDESLARAIADACDKSGEPASAFQDPEFLRLEPYPFIPQLTAALSNEIAKR